MKWMPIIRAESGMTLIELLIAIAVSGIVLAGATLIFTASSSSYSFQEEMAAMQQNIRMGKMLLERDIRMAGCGVLCGGLPGGRVYPVEFTNNVAANSNTDILVINYVDSDSSNCKNVLPQLTLNSKMPSASAVANVNEELTLTSSPPTPPYSTWTDKNGFFCNGVNYGGTPFKEFKVIIRSPDGKSDVVYITQTPGGKKLQNHPYLGFDNKVLNTYPPGSTVNFFSDDMYLKITYSYSNGTLLRKVNANPSEAIADNIEDLQFAFGLDTDNDGEVDKWIADGISGDKILDNAEKDQVRLIRINVLGRTSRQHSGQSNNIRPAIEDHAAAVSQDKFGRQLFQITVMPRNLKNNINCGI